MNWYALLSGLGAVGPFSCRVFLPAFVAALVLRFGGDFPIIGHWGVLAHVPHHQPVWFTSDWALIILGVLAALEVVAQKNAEARHLLQEFDVALKTGMALLTTFGVVSATDAHFVQQMAGGVHAAGWTDAWIPVLSAIGTFRIASLRKVVASAVYDHVEGTPLALLLNWLEDAGVASVVLLLLLFPVLVLGLIILATAALALARRRLQQKEEATRFACPQCGASIYRCATACPNCGRVNDTPATVGWLGATHPEEPAAVVADQPYRLAAVRRCPICATHLPPRRPFEPCPACGRAAIAEHGFVDAYLAYLQRRLPGVLGVCFAVGFVPILGLVVGTVVYRMALVLPMSQYLPMGRRFLMQWGIRLLFVLMVFLQLVPVLGAAMVPIMASLSYGAYRTAFVGVMRAGRPVRPETPGPGPDGMALPGATV